MAATEAPSSQTLRIERRFASPPERLFTAWTEVPELNAWSAPPPLSARNAVDLRVGGHYRITMTAPDGVVHVVGGTYREIDPPRRLVYTWKWEMDGFPETIVTVDFRRRADGGTDVVLVHQGIPNEDSRQRHEHGWDGCFTKLAALVG